MKIVKYRKEDNKKYETINFNCKRTRFPGLELHFVEILLRNSHSTFPNSIFEYSYKNCRKAYFVKSDEFKATNEIKFEKSSTIKILKSGVIWETPWFCQESLYCDT